MPNGKNWNDIFREIGEEAQRRTNPYDYVRQKYIKAFSKATNRNVVCYYSGWLEKTSPQFSLITSINDEDKNGFMACFHKLDVNKGLDLILHLPGGNVAATESIIHYIRSKFGDDIRTFVPQISMSGGTMLAFCGKEIWMGKHSNLGPIDPQFGSQPATLVIEEFDRAFNEIKADPSKIHVWRPILEQIPPTFLSACQQAVDWSKEIGKKALIDGMFKGQNDAQNIVNNIVEKFCDVNNNKHHSRHIQPDECIAMGLKIKRFEEDQVFQDLILNIHHAFMMTLINTKAAKIIENNRGILHNISVQ
jgi:hypothetical protein